MSDIISRFTAAGAEEYTADVREMATATEQLASTTKQAETQQKSLRTQLREVTQELARQQLAGKANTEEYKKLRDEAGRLKDAMADAAEEIAQAGSDTRGLDKALRATSVLVGGFTAVQGAAALFGNESENLQKTLLRVNAAMSVLNGLQAIQAELIRRDSLFTSAAAKAKELYTFATTKASAATRVLMGLLGGGLLIAIGLLIANYKEISGWISRVVTGHDTLSKSAKALASAEKEASAAIADELGRLRLLLAVAQDETRNKQERLAAIKELNELGPEHLKNLTLETIKTDAASKAIEQQIRFMKDKIKLQILTKQLAEAELELEEKVNKGLSFWQNLANAMGLTGLGFGSFARQVAGANDEVVAIEQAIRELLTSQTSAFVQTKEDTKAIEENTKAREKNKEVIDSTDPERRPSRLQSEAEIESKIIQELGDLKANVDDEALQAHVQHLKDKLEAEEEYNKQIRLQDTETFRQRSSKAQAAFEYAARFEQSLAQIVDNSYAIQLANLEEKRRKGLITEKEYAKQVAVIQQKQLKASKATGIIEATINGAVAALKAFAELGPIGGAIAAALIAGITATQIALIAKQKVPNVPGFFRGTKNAPPGMKWVGEEGPELVNDQGGYAIIPAGESQRIADMYKKWDVPTIQVPELIRPKPAYTPPSGERLNKIVVQKDNTEMLTELKFISQYIKQGNAAEWNNNNVLKGISAKITGRGFRT